MNLDAIFFLAAVAAILGQFSDARTTDVALQHGFVESNPIAAPIIKKLGISPLYAFKCGVLPAIGALVLGLGHEHAAIYTDAAIAGVGFVLGIVNYLKLHKAKISFSEIFGL